MSQPTRAELLEEIEFRRRARTNLHDYIRYTNTNYKVSAFSAQVCAAIDKFLRDVDEGKRPILILQAPPQHGKTEMVSRRLPAYIMGRKPELHVATASYSTDGAHTIAQDVRRIFASYEHQNLYPVNKERNKYELNRIGFFNVPGASGSYRSVGVGAGLTGRTVDIGIIDDPIKDQQEALSEVTKESLWNWYQSVFLTRLSENSGQIVMATSWAEDDLPARIAALYSQADKKDRLTILRFPALNYPDETGFNPKLPKGALVPDLKSEKFLREQKSVMSDYWWSALYQQNPLPLGGTVFKDKGIRFYLPKQLPVSFDLIIDSWDCTFKDTDGSDYVVGQKWGKRGANSYLLHQIRKQMSFTDTLACVKELRNWRGLVAREVLIEDKANGPAVIDTLRREVFGIIAVEPDGSKLARAHAVTSVWEAGNVWIPHPDIALWIGSEQGSHLVGTFLAEILRFPAAANDDQVDSMTQALRRLYPLFGRMQISDAAIQKAMGR